MHRTQQNNIDDNTFSDTINNNKNNAYNITIIAAMQTMIYNIKITQTIQTRCRVRVFSEFWLVAEFGQIRSF